MAAPTPLAADALCAVCAPDHLHFETTAELEPLVEVPGQARALEALRFALAMPHKGYNAFVIGPEGAGKREMVRRLVTARAAGEAPGQDLCYVVDFGDARRPRALRLPAGHGRALRDAMARLVEDLQAALRATVESDEYQVRRRALEQDLARRQEAMVDEVREKARAQRVTLVRTPTGVALAPVDDEGEVIGSDEFQALPEEDRVRREGELAEVHNLMRASMRQVPRLEREIRDAIRALDREVTASAARHLLAEVRETFPLPDVAEWLDAVAADITDRAEALLHPKEASGMPFLAELSGENHGSSTRRYQVNLIVDRTGQQGAPVVLLDDPKLPDMAGRVEHRAAFGALVTDHTLIRGGALHEANGGYLVMDAHRLLTRPFSWDALKRCLRTGTLGVESPAASLGVIDTVRLEPTTVPLALKVVLLGDHRLYALLSALDPEFDRLFKVMVDFEDRMPADEAGLTVFARAIARITHDEGLRPLTPGAVARVVRQAARAVEDRERLHTNLEGLADLLREADHVAGTENGLVHATHVDQAVASAERRTGRLRDRLREATLRGSLRVATAGTAVGEVNGLSVIQVGRVRFGRPGRISARIRLGRGGVVDIEREVELGGPLHSKGVLILGGFLGGRFGAASPLAFSASLVFEQSYGGVDGDSASLAETLALLSALGDAPLRQDIAVTGSIDQQGRVQAVGGVNDKIEGFFDLCRDRGLSGTQGVVLPAANVQNLVLRPDVVEAARAGRFHVWAVAEVDEALALLTGEEPGAAADDGSWPADSLNGRVAARLAELATVARETLRPADAPPGGR